MLQLIFDILRTFGGHMVKNDHMTIAIYWRINHCAALSFHLELWAFCLAAMAVFSNSELECLLQ